jgi:hypothetical protein
MWDISQERYHLSQRTRWAIFIDTSIYRPYYWEPESLAGAWNLKTRAICLPAPSPTLVRVPTSPSRNPVTRSPNPAGAGGGGSAFLLNPEDLLEMYGVLRCKGNRSSLSLSLSLRTNANRNKRRVVHISTTPWRRMGEWRYSSTILGFGNRLLLFIFNCKWVFTRWQ